MKEFNLSGEDLYGLMESVLNFGPTYRVKVKAKGNSMSPFLKHHSVIVLKPVDTTKKIRFGDIVAVSNKKKNFIIIHRVIGLKKGLYLLKGDNNYSIDGWFDKKDILGIIDEIQGNGFINCKSIWQNTIIAIGSRTGFFNWILFPVLRSFKKNFKV